MIMTAPVAYLLVGLIAPRPHVVIIIMIHIIVKWPQTLLFHWGNADKDPEPFANRDSNRWRVTPSPFGT